MCKFKSGIILKGKVVLAPKENESHQALLESLGIEDNFQNAARRFVRVELIPPNGNKAAPIEQWKYNVDQDIVPGWYEEDPQKYEYEMREVVAEYMKDELKNVICGYDWTPVQDGEYTLYFMNGVMEYMSFGKNNNYAESNVAEYLDESQLLKDLKEKFGNKLVPFNLSLTSMDGFKDYGIKENCLFNVAEYLDESQLLKDLKEKFGNKLVPFNLSLTSMDGFKDYGIKENCLLAIPNIQVLMKYGEDIPTIDNMYWLANPNQTPRRGDYSCVQCVCSIGYVRYDVCDWLHGVRPFFICRNHAVLEGKER